MKALGTDRGRHDGEPEQLSLLAPELSGREAFEAERASGNRLAMESERSGSAMGSRHPEVSLVLVAHRSSKVLPRALAAWRREVAEASVSAEVVVVEQSEDSREHARVAEHGPDLLLERPNRGYAAGINAGVAAARGDVLLVGNPDVELAPGALTALLGALQEGWDVAGPQQFVGRFLFPPADHPSPSAELRRWLAGLGAGIYRRALAAEVRRWQRVWEARQPVAVPSLSGALLAFTAGVARTVGPWDEGYFLYFEENDWLRRARRLGCRVGLVPAARVEHRWGHAAEPSEQLGRFAASRRRYFLRHHPWAGRLAVGLVPGAMPLPVGAPEAAPDELPEGWLGLLSPASLGMPAARLEGGSHVREAVAEVARALPRPRQLTLIAFDTAARRPRGAWRWPADALRAGHEAASTRGDRAPGAARAKRNESPDGRRADSQVVS